MSTRSARDADEREQTVTAVTEPILETTRYDRLDHGPALVSWVYGFENGTRKSKTGLAAGLEFAVQVAGEWTHEGTRAGTRVCTPGTWHHISPGETYRLGYDAQAGRGLQVGFILYPEQIPALADLECDLAFRRDAPLVDRRLFDISMAFESMVRRGVTIDDMALVNTLVDAVGPHLETIAPDAVTRAQRFIDRAPEQQLYVEHLAEMADMFPVTFSRAFARRFGLTPIKYRGLARLNLAARRIWAEPHVPVAAIAEDCGFDDLAYFYRAFKAYHAMTPSAYARGARQPHSTPG
jgi:AraC-like DNA-binding protein